MVKSFFISACLVMLLGLHSCFPCDEPQQVFYGYVKLDVLDSATGNPLLAVSAPQINKDSVVVRSMQGDTLRYSFALLNGAGSDREGLYIYFLNFNDSLYTPSFEETQCRDMDIRLSSTKTFQIRVCFKSRQTKCGDSFATSFERIELFYKGQRIGSGSKTDEVTGVVRL